MTQHTTGNGQEAEGNEKRALVDGILLAGGKQRKQQRLEAEGKSQEATNMTQQATHNRQEAAGNGINVSNLGDYSTIVELTTDGKEIKVVLYGR